LAEGEVLKVAGADGAHEGVAVLRRRVQHKADAEALKLHLRSLRHVGDQAGDVLKLLAHP
jgi:hypothetical protein